MNAREGTNASMNAWNESIARTYAHTSGVKSRGSSSSAAWFSTMFDVTGAEMATPRGLLWACGSKALAVERTAAAAATVAKERMVVVVAFEEMSTRRKVSLCSLFIKKSTRNRLAVALLSEGRRQKSKSTFEERIP